MRKSQIRLGKRNTEMVNAALILACPCSDAMLSSGEWPRRNADDGADRSTTGPRNDRVYRRLRFLTAGSAMALGCRRRGQVNRATSHGPSFMNGNSGAGGSADADTSGGGAALTDDNGMK